MQLKFNKLFYLLLLLCFLNNCSNKENKVSPNIIYILADDLGYGEVGYNGQEIIKTPNIDLLATNGMVFTQHYSGAPVCAPARYSLITGKHMGHSYIRGMMNGENAVKYGIMLRLLATLHLKDKDLFQKIL